MASPFSVFRKYSGGMMIIMVILSLFLFTLTDLFMDPSANLWLLGILIGGAVFGIAGVGQGRWLQWGIGGAILGAALGYILPGFTQQGGIDSALGVIDEEEIYDLQVRRGVANRFIVGITEATFGEGTARFAPVFGLGRASEREDVIFGKLMRAEADRLGITVDKRMVQQYLSELTGDKLTKNDYIETRNALGYRNRSVDDDLLIEILGDEIKANMAYQTLRPRTTALPPAPEVYWQYFRRLNVRQQLDLAALDVDEFLDQVGEPSEAEINDLFTQFSDKFPGEEGPGAPGFRQPFEVKLAYVEVDSEAVEEEIDDVTDEDIQNYYDENKESPMIRVPVMPDFDNDTTPADPKPAAPQPTDEEATSSDQEAESGDSPAPAQPAPPEPKDNAPADPKPADAPETADEPAGSEDESGAAAPADAPAKEEATPEPTDDPAAEESSEESSAEPESDAQDEAAGDSCGPFEPDESSPESEQASEPAADSDAQNSADESTEESTDDANASPPADSDSQDADPQPATEPAGDADDKTASDATDSTPASQADDKSAEDPLPLVIPQQTDSGSTQTDGAAGDTEPAEPQYEYRELDDALKAEIREEIKRQRVAQAIDQRIEKAKLEMETLANQRSSERFSRLEQDPEKYEGRDEEAQEALKQLRQEMQPVNEDINAKLKAFAEENDLAYVETPLLGQYELLDEEDYPIGSATEPNANPMLSAQSPTVAVTVFQGFSGDEQTNDTQLYIPDVAVLQSPELDGGSHHYVYWVTDFSYSHVPTLEEVRDEVVLEWKRLKARDLVKERAEALVEQVRSGLSKEGEEKQAMADVLKDATMTGDENGTSIPVKTTLPFSWMRTSSAAPNSFQRPQARLSTIQFDAGGTLDLVGNEFMEQVFNELNDEEVGIVPNADRSKFYVVHVKNRFPTPEIGEDGLRERFANEGKQFAFQQSPILGPIQQDLQGPATRDWINSVWRRYGIDPDGSPEDE